MVGKRRKSVTFHLGFKDYDNNDDVKNEAMKHPQIHGLTEEYALRSATGNNYHLSTLTEYIPFKSPVKEYLADCDVYNIRVGLLKMGVTCLF